MRIYNRALSAADVYELYALPSLNIMPDPYEFGAVAVGSSMVGYITVTNDSVADIMISSVAPSGSADFSIVLAETNCLSTLAPTNTCQVAVEFTPGAEGVFSASLDINTGQGTFSSSLSGQGVDYDTAVESPGLSWSTQGDAHWFVQSADINTGPSALQSGLITHNQFSEINTTIAGPASITFQWKVSSESGYDFLIAEVNGFEKARIDGEVNWTEMTLNLPEASNTVTWRYTKDGSQSSGLDAGWIDNVTVGAPLPLEVSPSALEFFGYPGEAMYQSVEVLNTFGADVTINNISTSMAEFSVIDGTCTGALPRTLINAEVCTIGVEFLASAAGWWEDDLIIETDQGNFTVLLQGEAYDEGMQEPDPEQDWPEPLINSATPLPFPTIAHAMDGFEMDYADEFTFTVPSDQQVALFVDSQGGDSYGELFDSGGNLIALNDDYMEVDFRIFAYLEAGEYTLRVRGYANDPLGPYAVTIDNNDDESYGSGSSLVDPQEPSYTAGIADGTGTLDLSGVSDVWQGSYSSAQVSHTIFFIEPASLFEANEGSEIAALIVPGYAQSLNLGDSGSFSNRSSELAASMEGVSPLVLPLAIDSGYQIHVAYYNAPSETAIVEAFANWSYDGPPAEAYLIGGKDDTRIWLEVGMPDLVFGRDVELDLELRNDMLELRVDHINPERIYEIDVSTDGWSTLHQPLANEYGSATLMDYGSYPVSGGEIQLSIRYDFESYYEAAFALPDKALIDPHRSLTLSGANLQLDGSVITLLFDINQPAGSVYGRVEQYRGGTFRGEGYIERWGGLEAGSHSFSDIVESLFYDLQAGDEIRLTKLSATNDVGILQVKSELETSNLSVIYEGPGEAFLQSFETGWNLAAVPVDRPLRVIDLEDRASQIKTVWIFEEGRWLVWTPDSTLRSRLDALGYGQLDQIDPGEGFWGQVSTAFVADYDVALEGYSLLESAKLLQAPPGWHLLGTGEDITPAAIASARSGVQVIWGFKGGTWRVYSPDADTMSRFNANGVATLETIQKGEGVWVKVQ